MSASRTAAPERASRARQRLRLIDACISALYEHGPSRTTIDKVVAIADMSPGIVNFYFETKAALLVACLDHLAREFEDHVLVPVKALQHDPAAALALLIDRYLDPKIANPRKISVWYAFWGESTSRDEYLAICGKRDLAFADMVQALVAARIEARGDTGLDADALSLGLIGCLEMQWQEIAFKKENEIDYVAQRRRCRAYLSSIFPIRAALRAEPVQASASLTGATLLVAAQLAIAGIPASPVAGAQSLVLAHPPRRRPQAIAVRMQSSRDSQERIELGNLARMDWIAFVLQGNDTGRGRDIHIVPAALMQPAPSITAAEVASSLGAWNGNFALRS